MGRKLPWKTSTTPSGPEMKFSLKSESPCPAPSRLPNPGTPSASRKKPRRERVKEVEDGVRSPSTSPPPEPPQERFMRPGLDHDDRYRMVEDEFLNMAHQFTIHIHASEYSRLKNLAKHQNADKIREIERPVVGAPTLLARQRQDNARRIVKHRNLLGSDTNEKGPPYAGSSLQGLMESPRKEHKWIAAGFADAAETRASAGFGSQKISPLRLKQGAKTPLAKKRRVSAPDDDETDNGGDLDLATPSRTPVTKAARTAQTSSPTLSRSAPRPAFSTPRVLKSVTNTAPRPGSSVKRPTTAPGGNEAQSTAKRRDPREDIDDDDPFGITKRRLQRQKSKEQFRRTEENAPAKLSLDDIPSFI
ncbi:hypothetical protein F53441_12399 [Fusarium austroafricanum]|uniref:Uncharacterized protein n=1 Tax=Fusarium austroafricanum TaxID=2364996 RepID=A0A8H4JVY5_9HYPO|nr:hypothetical protein F53441_12399 [Fusarium austroafricanum]